MVAGKDAIPLISTAARNAFRKLCCPTLGIKFARAADNKDSLETSVSIREGLIRTNHFGRCVFLNAQDVERVVAEVIAEVGASGPRDMGKVMKPALEKLGDAADGKQVSEIVKRLLS